MPQLSLRVRIQIGFMLILLPVLGLVVYGYRQANETRVNGVLDDQMRTAQAVAALVDASFDEAVSFGWALGDNPVVRTFDVTKLDPYLAQLSPCCPQYEILGIITAEGDGVGTNVTLPPGFQRRRAAADQPYFKSVMATGKPTISQVAISRVTYKPIVTAAVPVLDSAGTPIGAVFVTLSLRTLAERLETVALGPEQSIVVVDTTGRAALYTARTELPWEERDISTFEPVKAGLEGKSTEARGFRSPILQDTRIGAFVPTSKYGWVVGVTVREDIALAPVAAALRDQLIGFGGVTLLSLLIALLASHRLVRPIRRLTEHTMALGRGDLQQRVAIKTGDEFEDLGETFNRMAERLGRTLGDLQAVLDATETGIVMYDRDLRIRVLNRSMAEWFGLDAAQVIGRRFPDVAGEQIAPMLADPKKTVSRLDHLAEYPEETILDELEVTEPEYRALRLYSGPVRDNGKHIGHIEVYTDITELRRREAESLALGQVADALVRELALERVVEVVVEQGQRVLKAKVALFLAAPQREELELVAQRGLSEQGQTVKATVPFSAASITAMAARTGRPQEAPDITQVGPELGQTREGAEREGARSIFAQPLMAKDHLVGVLVLGRPTPHHFAQWERELVRAFADLCAAAVENVRLYKELQETLELREEFISAAAHELKTPVATIKGYVQAMRKWAPEGHEPREDIALDAVNRQCDRISQRVHEMLDAVRLRRVLPEQAKVSFDLGDLAAEVVKRVQATTDKHRLVLVREGTVPVEADRERIEEVLASLLDNAIRYSPVLGQVEVHVYRRGSEGALAVRDHGVGIAAERQQHIFEPFYEPVPTGATGYRGVAALSLYLSKLIVERHKGHIWFESEEGKGSTFSFSLPLAQADNDRGQA